MILKEMIIHECWCEHCSEGQMRQIHDILFKEQILMQDLIDRKITCEKCGQENIITDVLSVVPTSFMVSSRSELSKAKANDDLNKWLNAGQS